MMKFMNDKGEILVGTSVNESKLAALELLKKALANEKYDYLGIRYIEINTREEIVKFIAKNFDIKIIPSGDLVKAEDAQLGSPVSESDDIDF
jgi:hypothetical protein